MLKKVIEQWRNKPIRDILVELYIDKDMSMRDVAKELNISLGIIQKWMKEYGISKNNDLWK